MAAAAGGVAVAVAAVAEAEAQALQTQYSKTKTLRRRDKYHNAQISKCAFDKIAHSFIEACLPFGGKHFVGSRIEARATALRQAVSN